MGQQCTLRLARWLDLELPNTEKAGLLKSDGGAYGEGQVMDEFEDDPRISEEPYYQRVRGENGYWPPNQLEQLPGIVFKKEKTKVWATVVIDSLESINAVDCSFGVRMKMFLVFKTDLQNTPVLNKFHKDAEKRERWEAILQNSMEMGGPYKLEDDEYKLFADQLVWPQSLDIRNKVTAERESEPDFQILDPFEGEVWIKCFEGLYICREVQELHIFPFDVQDLHLDLFMASKVDQDRFDLRVHTVEFSKSALELMEWSVYPPESDRKGTHGTSIRLCVVRNAGYFMQSVVLPSLIFSIVCLGAFVIPCAYEDEAPYDNKGDGAADRLSVTLTMMLTSVAFKFLISDELPKISYFTMLDSFLNQHFTFIFLLTMHFAVGPYYVRNKNEDWHVMYGLTVLFFLITLWWLFKAYILVKSREHLLPEKVEMPKGDAISWRWQAVPHIEDLEEGNGPPIRGWVRRSTMISNSGLRSGDLLELKNEMLPATLSAAILGDQAVELANMGDKKVKQDIVTEEQDKNIGDSKEIKEQPPSSGQADQFPVIVRLPADELGSDNRGVDKPMEEYDDANKPTTKEDSSKEDGMDVAKTEEKESVEPSPKNVVGEEPADRLRLESKEDNKGVDKPMEECDDVNKQTTTEDFIKEDPTDVAKTDEKESTEATPENVVEEDPLNRTSLEKNEEFEAEEKETRDNSASVKEDNSVKVIYHV